MELSSLSLPIGDEEDLKHSMEEENNQAVSEESLPNQHCRICYALEEKSATDPILSLGCACQGDISYGHQSCLKTWFYPRFLRTGSLNCEICRSPLGDRLKEIIRGTIAEVAEVTEVTEIVPGAPELLLLLSIPPTDLDDLQVPVPTPDFYELPLETRHALEASFGRLEEEQLLGQIRRRQEFERDDRNQEILDYDGGIEQEGWGQDSGDDLPLDLTEDLREDNTPDLSSEDSDGDLGQDSREGFTQDLSSEDLRGGDLGQDSREDFTQDLSSENLRGGDLGQDSREDVTQNVSSEDLRQVVGEDFVHVLRAIRVDFTQDLDGEDLRQDLSEEISPASGQERWSSDLGQYSFDYEPDYEGAMHDWDSVGDLEALEFSRDFMSLSEASSPTRGPISLQDPPSPTVRVFTPSEDTSLNNSDDLDSDSEPLEFREGRVFRVPLPILEEVEEVEDALSDLVRYAQPFVDWYGSDVILLPRLMNSVTLERDGDREVAPTTSQVGNSSAGGAEPVLAEAAQVADGSPRRKYTYARFQMFQLFQ